MLRSLATPSAPDDVSATRRHLATEVRTLREPLRLALAAPRLVRAPRGDGAPVLCLPGYGGNDASLAPLRAYLAARGFEPHGWGLGVNRGRVPALAQRLRPRLARLAEAADRPVHLVGWSLGGVLARELARVAPEHVDRVVTFGSPIRGGARHTAFAGRMDPEQVDGFARAADERERVPVPRPLTVIHSRQDGIVAWRACLDTVNEHEAVEVGSAHLGMGLDPDVWLAVATALARPSPPAAASA
ncbi:MAG: esterase/lipase family protein [Actinomycetes bacterium]